MFAFLLFLFIVMPIIEIAVLLNVSSAMGGWNTIALVILTAVIGAYLVRQQGISTLVQAQQKLQAGIAPEREMAEGLLLAIAGVLLVTPGFVTDGVGLLLANPISRPILASHLLSKLQSRIVKTNTNAKQWQAYQQEQSTKGHVYEGEYESASEADNSDKQLNKPD